MSEKYVPKKMVAIYDMGGKREMICPNCHKSMGCSATAFWCFNEECRLFDVKYKAVKTLATLERIDC